MRGGVNEGWPGWARGSNPVRARGFRNGGKHLDPSGSAPLRGGAKEGDLGRIVQSGGSLQTRCKVERRHRCSSTFEEGSSRIACSPSSRGDSAHAMSLPSKGGYCGRKPAVSSRGSLAIDPGNRSKVANAWRHRCAMPTGTGSGARVPASARGPMLVGVLVRRIELQKSLGDVLVREASSARPERAAGGVNGA